MDTYHQSKPCVSVNYSLRVATICSVVLTLALSMGCSQAEQIAFPTKNSVDQVAPESREQPVQLTIAMILSLLRRLPESLRFRKGNEP